MWVILGAELSLNQLSSFWGPPHYYHPAFHGSYSIKDMLPAVVPDLTYGDLGIQDGSTASFAFAQMISLDTEEPERERIWSALLDYCRRDTEAMVRLLGALVSAGQPQR